MNPSIFSVANVAGVLVGVLVGAVNFYFLRRLVVRMVTDAESGKLAGGVLFLAKMIGLIAVVALLVLNTSISPIALMVGFGLVLVVGVCCGLKVDGST